MYNDVNSGQMCFKHLELYVKVFLEPSFHLFSMFSFLAFGCIWLLGKVFVGLCSSQQG